MKKALALLLIALMSISMVACGETSPSAGTDEEIAKTQEAEVPVYQLKETATVGGWEITVNSFEYRTLLEVQSGTTAALHGTVSGYGAYVIVKNIAKTSANFDYNRMKIYFDDGYLFDVFDARYVFTSKNTGKTDYLYLNGISDINNKLEPLSSRKYFLSFNGQASMMGETDKEMSLILTDETSDNAVAIFEIDRTQVEMG